MESWIGVGALLIGLLILKAIFELLLKKKPKQSGWPSYDVRPLLTKTELAWSHRLNEVLPPGLDLWGKIRMADLLKHEKSADLSKIAQKHIDFVIVERATGRVLVCIEIDDKSHRGEKRLQTDAFKDHALSSAGLTLVRIDCTDKASPQDLHTKLFGMHALWVPNAG